MAKDEYPYEPRKFLKQFEIDYANANARSQVRFFSVWRPKENGSFAIYMFAFRRHKKETETKIGFALYEDERDYMVSGSLDFCGMAGYRFIFSKEEEERRTFSYYTRSFSPELRSAYRYSMNGCFAPLLETEELSSYVSQHGLPHFDARLGRDPHELLDIWKEHPGDCERLEIMGFRWLIPSIRSLETVKNPEKRKRIMSFMKNEKEELIRNEPSWNQIFDCVKFGCRLSEVDDLTETDKICLILKRNEADPSLAKEARIWLSKQEGVTLSYWKSYLGKQKAIGADFSSKGTVMPRNFHESLSHCDSLINANKREALNKRIAEIASKLGTIEDGNLKVVPMKSVLDFVQTGKILKMCVGSYGYDEKMAKGETFCCVVYLKGKPMECCEISVKKREILQLYGYQDRPSPIHKEAYSLCQRYAKSFRLTA